MNVLILEALSVAEVKIIIIVRAEFFSGDHRSQLEVMMREMEVEINASCKSVFALVSDVLLNACAGRKPAVVIFQLFIVQHKGAVGRRNVLFLFYLLRAAIGNRALAFLHYLVMLPVDHRIRLCIQLRKKDACEKEKYGKVLFQCKGF